MGFRSASAAHRRARLRLEVRPEELDDLLADQQAISSASSQSLGDYLDDDDDSDSDTIIDRIRAAYQHDSHTRNLLENHNDNYRFEHDLIYVQNRLLVPNDDDIKEQTCRCAMTSNSLAIWAQQRQQS